MAVPSQCTDKLRSCILERHFPTVCSELLVTGQIEFFYFIPVLKGPGTVVNTTDKITVLPALKGNDARPSPINYVII